MFQIFVLLALLATCVAFSPINSRVSSSTIVEMADKSRSLPFLPWPENTVGMVGDVGFDPVGFSNWIDVKWLREAELKHGRVCMLAVVGFVFSSFVTLPGEVHQVSPVAAHDAAVKSGAMQQLLMWISFAEIISFKAISQMLWEGSPRQPGDYGFDPCGVCVNKSQEYKDTMALKELKNGRLAMLAFSGIVTQAVLTGKTFPF